MSRKERLRLLGQATVLVVAGRHCNVRGTCSLFHTRYLDIGDIEMNTRYVPLRLLQYRCPLSRGIGFELDLF